MRNGKANKHHKVEYRGALRNKEVCPPAWASTSFGGGAMSSRLHCEAASSALATPALLPAQRLHTTIYAPPPGDIEYPEWDWIDKLFVGAGIQSSKTHATHKRGETHGAYRSQHDQQSRSARNTVKRGGSAAASPGPVEFVFQSAVDKFKLLLIRWIVFCYTAFFQIENVAFGPF
jgi:hypothetical protein